MNKTTKIVLGALAVVLVIGIAGGMSSDTDTTTTTTVAVAPTTTEAPVTTTTVAPTTTTTEAPTTTTTVAALTDADIAVIFVETVREESATIPSITWVDTSDDATLVEGLYIACDAFDVGSSIDEVADTFWGGFYDETSGSLTDAEAADNLGMTYYFFGAAFAACAAMGG